MNDPSRRSRAGAPAAGAPSPSTEPAEPLDVEQLVEEVRERLAGARPGDQDRELEGEAPLPDEALERALERYRRAHGVDPALPARSHRALIGPLVSAVKGAVRRLVLSALAHRVERSEREGEAAFDYAQELFWRMVGMERGLRDQLDRIEARQVMELEGLRRRVAELEAGAPERSGPRPDGEPDGAGDGSPGPGGPGDGP